MNFKMRNFLLGGVIALTSVASWAAISSEKTNMDISDYLKKINSLGEKSSGDVRFFESLINEINLRPKNKILLDSLSKKQDVKDVCFQEVQLLFSVWPIIEADTRDAIDDGPPVGNVNPPEGSKIPAGASPSAIADKQLREEYIAMIHSNELKGRRYRKAVRFKRKEERWFGVVKELVKNCIMDSLLEVNRIDQLLGQSKLTAQRQNEIKEHISKK